MVFRFHKKQKGRPQMGGLQYAFVAQTVEHWSEEPSVDSSKLSKGTIDRAA